MLKFIVVCGAATASALLAAQAVMSFEHKGTAMAAVAVSPAAPATTLGKPSARPAEVVKAADGHFWAEAKVNSINVRFLVDTGATAVALTTQDARRLGFDPSRLEYGYKVMTASGEARAAKVTLDTVSVAKARVQDVEAFVIERGLETSLLGMTYLGRLERFEATKTALILTP